MNPKTIVEDAQRKFTVLKARSWRVVEAKVHNLTVNEKNKKIGLPQYIHLYLSFTLLILFCVFHIIITILEHRQNVLGVYRKL